MLINMNNDTKEAKLVLSLMDLTSLKDNETQEDIEKLCRSSVSSLGHVAAICIYSQWVDFVVEQMKLKNEEIRIATVVNFPHAQDTLSTVLYDVDKAIHLGVNEIDMVLPYHQVIEKNYSVAEDMIYRVKKLCGSDVLLKVIIESGELKTIPCIEDATKITIFSGGDFVKTSTGKVPINATLESANTILKVISQENPKVGFKASGGISTLEQAKQYLALAKEYLGLDYLSPKTLRFGASSLLNDILLNHSS